MDALERLPAPRLFGDYAYEMDRGLTLLRGALQSHIIEEIAFDRLDAILAEFGSQRLDPPPVTRETDGDVSPRDKLAHDGPPDEAGRAGYQHPFVRRRVHAVWVSLKW